MSITISILCDNNISGTDFIGEHGFSVLIKTKDKRFLFDAGREISLKHNLGALKENLTGIDGIVLSHGHYDHTEGLGYALEQTGPVEITAHPDIFSAHSSVNLKDINPTPRYVGCPYSREDLEKRGARFHFLEQTTAIAPGIWFIVNINREPEHTALEERLVIPQGDTANMDPITDDAVLLLETDTEPVLLLGCAHSGLYNILNHLDAEMEIKKLKAILGGTHLKAKGHSDLTPIMERIRDFDVDTIGVSHCTGFYAAAQLAGYFGPRFVLAAAGSVFDL